MATVSLTWAGTSDNTPYLAPGGEAFNMAAIQSLCSVSSEARNSRFLQKKKKKKKKKIVNIITNAMPNYLIVTEFVARENGTKLSIPADVLTRNFRNRQLFCGGPIFMKHFMISCCMHAWFHHIV